MKAEYGDLKHEQWLRLRNSGAIEWVTRDGKHIPIKDLDDNHLSNIINMIEENTRRRDEALEALGSIGDMDF
jgi:hypothetical protein